MLGTVSKAPSPRALHLPLTRQFLTRRTVHARTLTATGPRTVATSAPTILPGQLGCNVADIDDDDGDGTANSTDQDGAAEDNFLVIVIACVFCVVSAVMVVMFARLKREQDKRAASSAV